MAYWNVLPYSSVYIDNGGAGLLQYADFSEIIKAARRCCFGSESPEARARIISELSRLLRSPTNANHVLPCLSVRTGFDLFLMAMQFAPGSEIIMSAVNIPSMAAIAERHGLRVVPLDIRVDTLAPKEHLLPRLITGRTVVVLVAHIYGAVLDVSEVVETCRQQGLWFVEDCAEAFGGLNYLGHPMADVTLFSFGIIKFRTAFGGAVVKVRDAALHQRMVRLYDTFPAQSGAAYLRKLLKYAFIFLCLNSPHLMAPGMTLGKSIGWNYQNTVVEYLRGFKGDALDGLRCRPSVALLTTLHKRLSEPSDVEFALTRSKARYVVERLKGHVKVAGLSVTERNYWLFPVVVENAPRFCSMLNHMGVDAYRGATQLDVILPDTRWHHQHHSSGDKPEELDPARVAEPLAHTAGNEVEDVGRTTHYFALSSLSLKSLVGADTDDPGDFVRDGLGVRTDYRRGASGGDLGNQVSACCPQFPSEAKYLIDHVVYLPVHKNVPYKCLDQICEAVKVANHVCKNVGSPHSDVWVKSKL